MRVRLRLGRPLPPRLKVLLLVTALLGLGALAYTRVLGPYIQATRDLYRQAEELRVRVESLRRQAAGAAEARRELAAVQAELAAVAATFPPSLDEPRLLEYWQRAATAAGLRLTGLRIGAAEAAGAFTRQRLELDAAGPYEDQVSFALALQGMPWLYRLDAVTLKAEGAAAAGPSEAVPPAQAGSAAGAGRAPMRGTVQATYRLSLFLDAPAPRPAGGPQPGGGGAAGSRR